MPNTPIHGTMTLARDKDGEPYSAYDGDADNKRDSSREHVTIKFARDENNQSVVHEIVRRDKPTQKAVDAVVEAGWSDMAANLQTPKESTIFGVKFEVGGPAQGTVVDREAFADPKAQTAMADAHKNYWTASFHTIPPIGGEQAQASAIADVSRYREAQAPKAKPAAPGVKAGM